MNNKTQEGDAVFDDIIADIISNKEKLNPIVTELFIRGKKLNIFTVFITEPYFAVPNHVKLNLKHFLLRKFQTNESFNKSHLIIH